MEISQYFKTNVEYKLIWLGREVEFKTKITRHRNYLEKRQQPNILKQDSLQDMSNYQINRITNM